MLIKEPDVSIEEYIKRVPIGCSSYIHKFLDEADVLLDICVATNTSVPKITIIKSRNKQSTLI